MGWLGPEDPALKERLTSLLDDVPCLSARSPRHSNGHGGDEHRPWVVHVLELFSWMDEPLPEDYKGSSVVQKSEDLHGFTMIYHPTAGEKIM